MKKALNLGCGRKQFPDFVNIDIDKEVNPDIVWDLNKGLPLEILKKKNYFEEIIMFESIEHLQNFQKILLQCFEALKPNGKITITTHNYRGLMHRIKALKGDSSIFWNFSHVICFTDVILKKELEFAGFKDIVVKGNSFSFKYLPPQFSGNIKAIAIKEATNQNE